ncbi:MAG TPA: hypothetical protein VH371_08390 [Candidatus Limnocylindrales bacterium]
MSVQSGTEWSVVESEGLDAIAFLGALSGVPLYLGEYPTETPEFSARLAPAVIERLKELTADASSSGFGLMWPNLANGLSVEGDSTIGEVIDSLDRLGERILTHRAELDTWSESDWQWLIRSSPSLRDILIAMREAGFADFRRAKAGSSLADRAQELASQLASFDVVTLDRQLSGKDLTPRIEIVLSYFCRPHGVRIHGQRFIQSPDYDLMTTVRIAAHELLHPPIDMKGPVATALVEQLEKDKVLVGIVKGHDPSWGYTTVEGVVDEDICQALDQLVIEQLSVARNPADRWHEADGGMHVLAAGLYGMLRDDGWVKHGGGSIESWLADALSAGRLEPADLHPVAARVLERPVDQLWPIDPR